MKVSRKAKKRTPRGKTQRQRVILKLIHKDLTGAYN